MNIQKHLNWPISRGLLEFFRSCPRKVLHTSILTVKIRFVSLFRCPTRHLRTPSGPLGVPRLPPGRSASVRQDGPGATGTRRAPIKTAQGPYPRRALSRPGGGPSVWIERSTVALPLQSWLGLSLARNRFEEKFTTGISKAQTLDQQRRGTTPAGTFRRALSRPGYSVWIESSALQSRDSPVLGLGEVVS